MHPAEVDDRGIDFVARHGSGPFVEVQVKLLRVSGRGELVKAGIHSVYFDAFANDYQDDAFLAVASQVIAEVPLQAGPMI